MELKHQLMLNKEMSWVPCYIKSEADTVIAELKAEEKRKDGVGKRWFERCMEARTENFKLKRALWIARARNARNMKAYENLDNYTSNHPSRNSRWNYISSQRYDCWFYAWEKVERKCLKKAEEYK